MDVCVCVWTLERERERVVHVMCPFHVQLASETKQKPRNEKRKKNSSDMLKLGSLVVQVSKCECNKIIKDIVVSVQ